MGGGAQTREWCSDFSFVRYPVMIILASKPQIWPCFAVDHSINGDGAALPRLRSLSAAKLCWQRQSGTQHGGHFECTHRRSSEAMLGLGQSEICTFIITSLLSRWQKKSDS